MPYAGTLSSWRSVSAKGFEEQGVSVELMC